MLKNSDLRAFLNLVRRAEHEVPPPVAAYPDAILRAEAQAEDLLHRNDCARLCRSLGIACAAGDISESCQEILEVITRSLEADDHRYLPLTRSEEWLSAIRWAMPRIDARPTRSLPHRGQERQSVVGMACRDLRERGYNIPIGASGPEFDGDTRIAISERVDSLVAKVGGVSAIETVCEFMGATRRLHDGMWLLGNRVGGYDRVADPAFPVGWLVSIALRHIRRKSSAEKPAEVWKEAVSLAIDFAASLDCQRYNPFDGFNLDVPDFLPALEESVKWRELFTLPQVPTSALSTLRRAFSQITWPAGTNRLRSDVDGLFRELNHLLAGLADDRLTAMPKRTAVSLFPLLSRHAGAYQGTINANYLDPFGTSPRDHERYVFFEAADKRVVLLPSSFTAAAACEAIFRFVWTKATQVASDVVGNVIEKTVVIACRSHTSRVWEKLCYRANGVDLEIDVAVRDGQNIVLFETKAKSLTSESRTGDMMAFIDDYTKSFLTLLRQLVRHERNIRRGCTPLTRTDKNLDNLHITKVAVSPLSYGPASDQVLQNALLRAMARAVVSSLNEDPEHVRILNAFNAKVKDIVNDVIDVSAGKGGEGDLGRFMMHVSWFDVGQLLYSLHRGHSVAEALSALRHITASTRDFWTEVALADRQGLTEKKWRRPSHHGRNP